MLVLAQVAFAFSLLTITLAEPSYTTAYVEQGALLGLTEAFVEWEFIKVAKEVDVFRGVPYAEPPEGPLRFEPPWRKQNWDYNIFYDATYFKDSCVQDLDGFSTSEDCLYLNIYAPRPKIYGGAAVMVWIHGGGFIMGSGSMPDSEGHPLVALGDVIVVTINYRLNVFGFLTTGDDAAPGNLGLQDQLFALQWIKNNIEAFGGDPDRITIFGESAGSASVSWLVTSWEARGLFSQAIMQSGTAFSPWAWSEDREKLRRQAFQLGERLGCEATESIALLNCLKERNSSDILSAASEVSFTSIPVVDHTFVKDTPTNLYTSGWYNRVPILLGTNADEGTLFVANNPLLTEYIDREEPPIISKELFEQLYRADLSMYSDSDIDQVADAIKLLYIDWSQADYEDTDYFRSYVDFFTDFQFACGANKVARFHAQDGYYVFLYQMTHVPIRSFWNSTRVVPDWLGATHGEDLPYVFGVPFMDHAASQPGLLDDEKKLSVKFMKYWTNFAVSGNPNWKYSLSPPDPDLNFWPWFRTPWLEYMELNLNLTTSRALKSDVCHFWNSYIPRLKTALAEMDDAERDWRQAFYTWKYTDMEDWRDQFNRYKAANITN